MSVYLGEVLKNAGYDIENNIDDITWLLAQREEWEKMIEKAEEKLEELENNEEEDY